MEIWKTRPTKYPWTDGYFFTVQVEKRRRMNFADDVRLTPSIPKIPNLLTITHCSAARFVILMNSSIRFGRIDSYLLIKSRAFRLAAIELRDSSTSVFSVYGYPAMFLSISAAESTAPAVTLQVHVKISRYRRPFLNRILFSLGFRILELAISTS